MIRRRLRVVSTALALLASGAAIADQPFFYPPDGRTKAQQQQDQFEAGAAVGEVANDNAGEGAAAGATLGLLRARMAEKKAATERAATEAQGRARAEQQQAAQAEELRAKQNAYQRARCTCFKARGYTVSEG